MLLEVDDDDGERNYSGLFRVAEKSLLPAFLLLRGVVVVGADEVVDVG